MSYVTIKYEIKEENIAVITMMREKEMNCLSLEMVSEMKRALIAARKDEKVRVVILTGQGRAFCCGSDLKEYMVGEDFRAPVKIREYLMRIQSLFMALEACEKPVIAAINGYALGGGVELSLACDFRIASGEARFALTETSLGAIACVGGVQRLPKFIGRGKAIELNMLGRMLKAEEVEKLGLLYCRVPSGEVMEAAIGLGLKLCAKSPFALAMVKSCMSGSENISTEEAMRRGVDAMLLCVTTGDGKEGMRSYLEKRAADFPGISLGLDGDDIGD